MTTMLKRNSAHPESPAIPSYMLSNPTQQPEIQHDDLVERNARIRLDYKKSFEDDLLFFPEPKFEHRIMSPEGTQAQMDTEFILQKQQQQQQQTYRGPQQKENLVLLMVLKRLERQQQQQQFYQNQLSMRKGAHLNTLHQQPQEQHIGEPYVAPQNIYNYVNLRASG